MGGWCQSGGGHVGELGCWKAMGWGLETTGRRTDLQVPGVGWGAERDPPEAASTLSKDGEGAALRNTCITPNTYNFLQLKDQAGGPGPQRFTLRSWDVAAGSPTWILLEFPQSCHLTTTTITVTVRATSKNPACSQKLSRLPSKWHISLPPPVPFALCHLPGRGLLRTGCPRGWGVGLPSGCWLRGLPLLAVVGLVLPWL